MRNAHLIRGHHVSRKASNNGNQKSSAVDQPDAPGSSAGDDDAERNKVKRKEYEKELRKLQTELCSLQDWVKAAGERIIVIFEGRDAAGKGGTIRAMTERVSPRTFRLVALPAPSDRENRNCTYSAI